MFVCVCAVEKWPCKENFHGFYISNVLNRRTIKALISPATYHFERDRKFSFCSANIGWCLDRLVYVISQLQIDKIQIVSFYAMQHSPDLFLITLFNMYELTYWVNFCSNGILMSELKHGMKIEWEYENYSRNWKKYSNFLNDYE